MDYDQTEMPESYDRGRRLADGVLDRWMAVVRQAAPASVRRVLDLGCGTGRFSGALADAFPRAAVIGVDPSTKMLAQARAKAHPRVRFVEGAGEAVPVSDGAVDLIFASMMWHHLTAPEQAAAECLRVLRPGGVVFLRTGLRERAERYAYVPFFPTSRPLLEAALPIRAVVREAFADFALDREEAIVQRIAEDFSAYADKLALRADSILVRVPDPEFAAGLARLRAYAATPEGRRPVEEPIDYLVFRRP